MSETKETKETKGISYSDAMKQVTKKMIGTKFDTSEKVDVEYAKPFGNNKKGDFGRIGKIKADALKLKGIVK